MAFKTTYSQYDNKIGLFSTEGDLDLTTIPSNETVIQSSDAAYNDGFGTSIAVGDDRIVVGSEGDDDNGSESGSAYIFDLNDTQLAKITASDGAADDRFGNSVAVGCGRIVVGAHQDDDNGTNSGSAYIYNLDGTNETKITASDGAANDIFGYSVAVGCGRIVVGASKDDDNGNRSGSAYIFDLDGTQLAKITASDGAADDEFGHSVAVGNGRIVVGVGGNRSSYIFDLDGNQLAKITPSDGTLNDRFGRSVAVGSGRIVVGAAPIGSSSGSAYIFDLDGSQLAKITPSDGATNYFGESVAVGNGRIVVGHYAGTNQSAYVFDLDGNELEKIIPTSTNGSSFSKKVFIGGGKILISRDGDSGSGNGAGYVYIYETPNIKDIFSIVD